MRTPRQPFAARPHAPLAALLAAACTVGPDYTPPPDAAPAEWLAGGGARVDSGAVASYWNTFGDATLDGLLRRAAAGNRDLVVAVARLQEARARARAAGSERWPRLDLVASWTDSRISENGFLEGLASGGPGGAAGAVFPGQEIALWQLGVDASWEVDLFGRLRRGEQAADADAEAAAFDLGAVVLALQADVADAYLELRSLQQRAVLAERLVASHQSGVEVLQEQVTAGVANALDLARARTELANQRAQSAALAGEVEAVVRRIETLLGERPGALAGELAAGGNVALPAVPDVLAIDVPAATLRRRPDVRAAERRLAAATARVGVATADLYPQLSLTGVFGLQAQDIGDVPQGDSRFWAFGPRVRWPLFDFGRVRAGIDVADARAAAAMAAYESVVLRALADVEIALVRVARWRRQLAALTDARDAARTAAQLAEEQYRSGVLEYLDLLDAQRTLDAAEDDHAQGQASLAHAVVALGRALGGGLPDGAAAAAATPSTSRGADQ